MTEFQKAVYAGMTSADRVLLFLEKHQELLEFARNMTDDDVQILKWLIDEENVKRACRRGKRCRK